MGETDTLLCIKGDKKLIVGERYTYKWRLSVSYLYGKFNGGEGMSPINTRMLDIFLLENFVVDKNFTEKDIFTLKMTGKLPT